MPTASAERFDGPALPDELPVVPLRDVVVFPYLVAPLSVSRESSTLAIDRALGSHRMVVLVNQLDPSEDEPGADDLHSIGTVALIMRMLKLPDQRIRVLLQGLARAEVRQVVDADGCLAARIREIPEEHPAAEDLESEALVRTVKRSLERASSLGKNVPSEVLSVVAKVDEPAKLTDLVASNLDLRLEEARELLATADVLERLRSVNKLLNRDIHLLLMQQEIDSQTRDEIDRSQREYYLRQQLKAIQMELGDDDGSADDIEQLRSQARRADMPESVLEEVDKQLRKLERMHPDSAESTIVRNYVEAMVGLPWGKASEDNLDLRAASRVLEADHEGLEPIKERILEYLSVKKLRGSPRGPILCFVGPPGVGKTSLGRSIARALSRRFVRISLGGVRDEAEIRGHRRTYVGAMPGRIIQGIQQAGTCNPVLMLDEVDKIGSDYRGDPSAALLEVLDPEQNASFRDHYLGVPYDLSQVMFVATANVLDTIHPAFLDRMEVIELSGYTEEEKLTICRRHLLPRQLDEHGLSPEDLQISDNALRRIIAAYTREAGLRNLERLIAKVCRKSARARAEGRDRRENVTLRQIQRFLGAPRVHRESMLREERVGIATGLAWTPAGGDILFVEATTMPGRGELILTGQLGDVMKESARAGLSYARSRARELGIEPDTFAEHDIHVHVPEGAIPKDGPSAGVTMVVALVSALTGRPVRRDFAMSGELTLRGEVLPVGGIKEKLLAARRAGIRMVAYPAANRTSLDDIPPQVLRELRLVPIEDVGELLAIAFADGPGAAATRKARPRNRRGAESIPTPVLARSRRRS